MLLAIGMILARIALLPLLPLPDPLIQDEFSYLLAADTFAHGRLANPTVPMPEFFESPHVLVAPIYASKYPPGQGLLLALGKKLFGHPYWGVVLSGAAMVFLFCWAADAWLPPQWTLIAGGLSAVLFFIRHYWFSSYWGGALAACGGALVVGALGRLLRGKSAGVYLSAGALILYVTRPYEGGVLCLAALGILTFQFFKSGPDQRRIWLRTVILPNVAVLLAAIPLMAWYNLRTTGRLADLPYLEYSRQYDQVPTLWFLNPYGPKVYSNANSQALHNSERNDYERIRHLSPSRIFVFEVLGFLLAGVWLQFLTFGLLLLGIPWARMHKRKKWLVTLLGAGAVSLMLEVWMNGHYSAPYTAVELILIVAAGRALWYRLAATRWRGPVFLTALIILFVPLGVDYAGALQARPTERGRLERKLESQGGRHLVFVNYDRGNRDWMFEWVYNGADLNAAPVLFAHLQSDAENRRLIEHFPGRTVWIVELGPAETEVRLRPYDSALALAAP
ncbi:MAG: hypothetical protein ACRD4E_00625 [Bryobacteraceae bacterium]